MNPKTEKIANPATKLDPPFTRHRTNVSLGAQTEMQYEHIKWKYNWDTEVRHWRSLENFAAGYSLHTHDTHDEVNGQMLVV